jgi:hypothetical protein
VKRGFNSLMSEKGPAVALDQIRPLKPHVQFADDAVKQVDAARAIGTRGQGQHNFLVGRIYGCFAGVLDRGCQTRRR